MSRSTHSERAQRLNAAFDLLARNYTLAEATAALAQEFSLSRRQAYRYLQAAQGIQTPLPVCAPRMAITLKVPEEVIVKLRAYAQTRGLRLGDIVAYAVLSFLDKAGRHG